MIALRSRSRCGSPAGNSFNRRNKHIVSARRSAYGDAVLPRAFALGSVCARRFVGHGYREPDRRGFIGLCGGCSSSSRESCSTRVPSLQETSLPAVWCVISSSPRLVSHGEPQRRGVHRSRQTQSRTYLEASHETAHTVLRNATKSAPAGNAAKDTPKPDAGAQPRQSDTQPTTAVQYPPSGGARASPTAWVGCSVARRVGSGPWPSQR